MISYVLNVRCYFVGKCDFVVRIAWPIIAKIWRVYDVRQSILINRFSFENLISLLTTRHHYTKTVVYLTSNMVIIQIISWSRNFMPKWTLNWFWKVFWISSTLIFRIRWFIKWQWYLIFSSKNLQWFSRKNILNSTHDWSLNKQSHITETLNWSNYWTTWN